MSSRTLGQGKVLGGDGRGRLAQRAAGELQALRHTLPPQAGRADGEPDLARGSGLARSLVQNGGAGSGDGAGFIIPSLGGDLRHRLAGEVTLQMLQRDRLGPQTP